MKNIRTLVMTAALTWVTSALAFTPVVDLKNAKVVGEGQCAHQERMYKCFLLTNDGKHYIVAVDTFGLLAVYLVPGAKEDYDEDEVTLLWTRVPSRRKDET